MESVPGRALLKGSSCGLDGPGRTARERRQTPAAKDNRPQNDVVSDMSYCHFERLGRRRTILPAARAAHGCFLNLRTRAESVKVLQPRERVLQNRFLLL